MSESRHPEYGHRHFESNLESESESISIFLNMNRAMNPISNLDNFRHFLGSF